jgi:hypothetical protein
MKVLISPLGLAPGVVTGAYYALREEGYGLMDKVISISTGGDLIKLCEREIAKELERAAGESGKAILYEPLSIPSNEISTSADVNAFSSLIQDILRRNLEAGHEVYLNLTGGRKSMVAAAAMAAQVYQPTVMFHLYVDEEIEREGQITTLLKKLGEKRRPYLKPPKHMLTLVEIPLLPVGQERTDLWASLFEIKVAEYIIRRFGYQHVRYSYYPPYLRQAEVGEVDIYAYDTLGERRRVLICECKLRTIDDPDAKPITNAEVKQLQRKAEHVEAHERQKADAEGYTISFKAWFVTNSSQADEAAQEVAKQHKIELKTAVLPGNWKRRADWSINDLKPMGKT